MNPETPLLDTLQLRDLLRKVFGFGDFRSTQEAVCRSVAQGDDVLLVMPTGAGKSLCYQIPGLARGGTTLVISPLLALIDDQVAKLKERGLRAQAIHSGISRDVSREACRDYLRGDLDFLFIAPERLAVPGFPELLAKRKPALIAIDEAHCISQWGHDFRPEYRKLGERLAHLRPCPIIALTATATPLVQDDIVQQLGIPKAMRFIQGFRRTNIAIQAHEVPRGSRGRASIALLKEAGRLPAIVYAPTRKSAEEIATELKTEFRADCYHAGMGADQREKVQTRFLSGKCDVIVATVAFGMGIDKADVRTVIHAGLSGSVEGYYQEIGRAGRDGLPSRAILLYSFSDQKTHEFFFERDYPEIETLQKIHGLLDRKAVSKRWLQERLSKIDADVFDKALEKLWALGGALVDPEENVALGPSMWVHAYRQQREYRQDALRKMAAFAESSQCRMVYFLKHFGDRADGFEPCGMCDRCTEDHDAHLLSSCRKLGPVEQERVIRLMSTLGKAGSFAAGRLFEDLRSDEPRLQRGDFERLLKTLASTHWVAISDESFERDGKKISYRKVSVTRKGSEATGEDIAQLEAIESGFAKPKKAKKIRSAGVMDTLPESDALATELFEKLRNWRLTEARQKGIPAFRVLSDRVLRAIASSKPATVDELAQVRGIGPKLCEKYGKALLSCLE
jgi:RecQ family ATP-dependent DNA helicase